MAGTTYTYAQLEQLWINNGGSAATAPVAAAVAMAESAGQAAATSANPDGGTNAGLWQLDTPGGGGAGYSVAQLQDPNTNAKAAVAASSGGANWATWETYVNGAYKAFVSSSTTPDPNVPASTGTGGTGVTQATLDAATQSASTCLIGFTSPTVLGIGGGTVCILSKANMRNIVGASCIVGGGVLVLAGVVLVVGIGLGNGKVRAVGGPVGMVAQAAARQVTGEASTQRREQRVSRAERTASVADRERRQAERADRQRNPARGRHARPGEK